MQDEVTVLIHNSSFERVEQFKCLGTNQTNKNSSQEEIMSRLKSGNACKHLAQHLLSSSLLSTNIKIKVYRPIILPIAFYRCETWSLTLRLMVFENRVMRSIFGPKRDEVSGEWSKLHNGEVNTLCSSPNIIGEIKSRRMK